MGNVMTVGFAGEYTDQESGLIYLRARYYDPATALFLTVDPLVSITRAWTWRTVGPSLRWTST